MNWKAPLTCLILAACPFAALAQESASLNLKPKLVVAPGSVAPWRAASAPASLAPKPAELVAPAAGGHGYVAGTCAAAADGLCYDPRSGSLVYKPLRRLMPEIDGLQRENIAIKRDRITFKYSFR